MCVCVYIYKYTCIYRVRLYLYSYLHVCIYLYIICGLLFLFGACAGTLSYKLCRNCLVALGSMLLPCLAAISAPAEADEGSLDALVGVSRRLQGSTGQPVELQSFAWGLHSIPGILVIAAPGYTRRGRTPASKGLSSEPFQDLGPYMSHVFQAMLRVPCSRYPSIPDKASPARPTLWTH